MHLHLALLPVVFEREKMHHVLNTCHADFRDLALARNRRKLRNNIENRQKKANEKLEKTKKDKMTQQPECRRM